MENIGKIVQVSGPVVDVEFSDNNLPSIKDALYVINNGKKCVMEVSQHIGHNTVRCIMLAASEGLCRDMKVVLLPQKMCRAASASAACRSALRR